MQVQNIVESKSSILRGQIGDVSEVGHVTNPSSDNKDTFVRKKSRLPLALTKLYAQHAIGISLAAIGAGLALVKAQVPQCAANDFSCWDKVPDPVDMYARLQEDLTTLDFGGCPQVCLMTPTDVHFAATAISVVGGIFFAVRKDMGTPAKIAAVLVANYGTYAAMRTKDYIGIAKAKCQQMGCPTEPLEW